MPFLLRGVAMGDGDGMRRPAPVAGLPKRLHGPPRRRDLGE